MKKFFFKIQGIRSPNWPIKWKYYNTKSNAKMPFISIGDSIDENMEQTKSNLFKKKFYKKIDLLTNALVCLLLTVANVAFLGIRWKEFKGTVSGYWSDMKSFTSHRTWFKFLGGKNSTNMILEWTREILARGYIKILEMDLLHYD